MPLVNSASVFIDNEHTFPIRILILDFHFYWDIYQRSLGFSLFFWQSSLKTNDHFSAQAQEWGTPSSGPTELPNVFYFIFYGYFLFFIRSGPLHDGTFSTGLSMRIVNALRRRGFDSLGSSFLTTVLLWLRRFFMRESIYFKPAFILRNLHTYFQNS